MRLNEKVAIVTGEGGSAAIELNFVSKSYGSVMALHPTDLRVNHGEFLTLLGPSGSGKTTLLNAIAGAAAPTSGSIVLNGRDITRTPPRNRGVGMVFQNYALMPHMSVFDNVAYPLRARRESKGVIGKKVTEALVRVGLDGFETRKPRQLSGGQQQRVGIARCIVYSPTIILMDEPLGALDKSLREQMQIEIKRLHNELGTTFIYVTHDQEEALNMSDRICLMSGGRIAQLGTPDELYFRPSNRFVAEFVGESNIFEGTLGQHDTLTLSKGSSFKVPQTDKQPGDAVTIMIRPENIQVQGIDKQSPPEMNSVNGTIVSCSFIGGMTRVAVRTESDLSITAKTLSTPSVSRPAPGDSVRLSWLPADTVVLRD